MALTYYPEGKTFRTEGELPSNCSSVTITIGGRETGSRLPFTKIAAIKIIEESYALGKAPAPFYRLDPVIAKSKE